MKSVLVVHESYTQAGGEDHVYRSDVAELRAKGHTVTAWNVQNSEIAAWSRLRQASLFLRTSWSHSSYRRTKQLVRAHRPDIAHFHNTLPLVSPSAFYGARSLRIPVVMTVHNYRLLCPSGLFFRNGRVCEDCLVSLTRGISHGCYRGSRVQTSAVALMLWLHRALGTWRRCVDAFVVNTEFMRAKLQNAGLPQDRIHIRPHVLPAAPSPGDSNGTPYTVFLGRLSPEKGIDTLLGAAQLFRAPVKVIGTGPLEGDVRSAAATHPALVHALGTLPHPKAMTILAGARALILPSRCYESFALVIAEAMSLGIPVIASDLGGRSECVKDSVNGFLFTAGDERSLAEKVNRLVGDPALRSRMSDAARDTYRTSLAPEISYRRLMEIYDAATRVAASRR